MSKKKITVEVPADEADQIVNAIDAEETSLGEGMNEPTVEDDLADDSTDATIPAEDALPPEDLPVVPVDNASENVTADLGPGAAAEPASTQPVDTSNPTQTPEPIEVAPQPAPNPQGPDTSTSQPVDPTAQPNPVDTQNVTGITTVDSNGVPIPTAVTVTPQAPSAADVTTPLDSTLNANTAPVVVPDPSVSPAATTDTTVPAPAAATMPEDIFYDAATGDQVGTVPANDSFYVWSPNGSFVKFYTTQDYGSDAFKFAKEHADQISGAVS